MRISFLFLTVINAVNRLNCVVSMNTSLRDLQPITKRKVLLKGGTLSRTAKAGCNPERSPLCQAIQQPGPQLHKSPAPRPAPEMGNFQLHVLLLQGSSDNNSYYAQELKHQLLSKIFSKMVERVAGSDLQTTSSIFSSTPSPPPFFFFF